MKVLFPLLLSILLLSGRSVAAEPAKNILSLIPASSPAVFISSNTNALSTGLFRMFGDSAGADTPTPSPGDGIVKLFRLLGLGSLPAGVNLDGPVAAAMPQFPFPLYVIPVSDYGLFLKDLGEKIASESKSPPQGRGLTTVTLGGKTFFSRREGSFALLSPMPIFLTPPPAGKGLDAVLTTGEKSLAGVEGLFFRLDLQSILALAEPFLQQFRTKLSPAPGSPTAPADPQPPSEQEQALKLLQAELDLLLKGLRQVRAFTAGISVDERGLHATTFTTPVNGSGFQGLLEGLPSHGHPLLNYFADDVAMAGAATFDVESLHSLILTMGTFIFDSGFYGENGEERAEWEDLMSRGLQVAGSDSAYAFGPSKSGGAFSSLLISSVKDAEKARALTLESFGLAERLMARVPLRSGMTMSLETEVESYHGTDIDHVRFDLALPGEAHGEEAVEAAMEALFGGSQVDIWIAFVDRHMVVSYYTPGPEDLKVMIDRLTSGEMGGLATSPAYRSATAPLPAKASSLFFLSPTRFARLFLDVMSRIAPESLPPLPPKFSENSSGIGSATYASGGSLRTDTFLPRRESESLREVVSFFKSLKGITKDGEAGKAGAASEGAPAHVSPSGPGN